MSDRVSRHALKIRLRSMRVQAHGFTRPSPLGAEAAGVIQELEDEIERLQQALRSHGKPHGDTGEYVSGTFAASDAETGP